VAYCAAGISVLVVWLARWEVDSVLRDQASFSFFFLAVSVAAWLGGLWPAVFTAIVSCLVGNYFFSHPYGTLYIGGAEEAISMAVFLLVSVVIGILAEISLRALERARIAERKKDEFMATVAHELRSPLSVIHYANALDRLTGEPARDHIDLIDEQVSHLNVMIQDLLDVSRIARGKIRLNREHVEAATIVEGAVIKAQPSIASRGHVLTVNVADEPIPLFVDPVRIEQVLTNLLVNAAKYTPDGGRISIRVQPVEGAAVFTVRDNGIGIAEEMLSRVFDPFVQADSNGTNAEGGLGIGLALVRKVVDIHGGTVQAVSAGSNRGSEFTVSLPLDVQAPAEPALVEA
jgi:signal transduction histidine kinase